MKRKRFAALFISILILGSIFPVHAAQENMEPISLMVRIIDKEKDICRVMDFIHCDGELYIRCPDISLITRYVYIAERSEEEACYSLAVEGTAGEEKKAGGDKTVLFDYDSTKVRLPDQDFEGDYDGAISYKGEPYLPLSSALPWLDCSCKVTGNRLTFTMEPVTYYELTRLFRQLPSLSLDEYLKDEEKTFGILSGSSAMKNIWDFPEGIRNAFTAALFHGSDPDYFYYDAYMSAFIEMAADGYVGEETAEDVFEIFGAVQMADSAASVFGVDLTEAEVSDSVAVFMAEYGLDASFQSDVYDFVDGVRAAAIMAETQEYLKPFVESMAAYEACFRSVKEYKEALQLLRDSTQDGVVHDTSERALAELEEPLQSTMREYLYLAIEKGLTKIFEEYSPVYKIYDIAAGLAKAAFPDTYEGVSAYSKIPVYADIYFTMDELAGGAQKLTAPQQQHDKKNAMLLAALAAKQTFESMASWESKLADPDEVDACIAACEELIVSLLLCKEGSEASLMERSEEEPSLTNWEKIGMENRSVFAAAIRLPQGKNPVSFLGLTVEEIAEIWGEDYQISPVRHGVFILYYEDNRSGCQFQFIVEGYTGVLLDIKGKTIEEIHIGKEDMAVVIADEWTNCETYASIQEKYPEAVLEENGFLGQYFCTVEAEGLRITYYWPLLLETQPQTDMASYVSVSKIS